MAEEFNYKRAHQEWCHPRCDALPQSVRSLYDQACMYAGKLGHDASAPVEFVEACRQIDPAVLEQAGVLFYYRGHWANGDAYGAYWKFKVWVGEAIRQLHPDYVPRTEQAVMESLGYCKDDFMEHKAGTPYTLDELPRLFRPHLEGDFDVVQATTVNHKPHPYMIGNKHIEAAQKYGGILGEQVCREVGCAHPGCGLRYDEHTYDRVLILKAARDLTNAEAGAALQKVLPLAEEHKLDGFAFVESPYRLGDAENSPG